MIIGKRFKHCEKPETAAKRIYIRKFTATPPELVGTKMEKERYLNALAEKTLRVVGVQPRHG